MSEPTFTAGQELYFEYSAYHHSTRNGKVRGEMVVIQKVGRRWMQLSNRFRVDVGTLVADGGDHSSPGRAYLSREEREKEMALTADWDQLRRDMPIRLPQGVTASDIAKVRELLRMRGAA